MLQSSGIRGEHHLSCWYPVATGILNVDCRRVELERKLAADATMSDERKQRQLQQLGKKESAFLRLKRTKLGLDDFRTVKVIGKGAFGEVRCMAHGRIVLIVTADLTATSFRSGWYRRPTLARYML